ncbi:hypothetical protein C2S51_005373 [Perilla frutescens var. frutescens]|nr:hypothetical protein C2S51_005373 [Perilla frutescens var. frutescens]
MQRRIRRALNCMRERTCVSYAKIASMGLGGICDVDHIITKATSHDDFPLAERYIHDFLKIFSLSPSSHSSFSLAISRRFRSTRSWRVALKCLLLLHRLLRSSPGLRDHLLWARTNTMLTLYPCNFRDCTSASDDYTAFIRSYARLVDESLDCIVDDDVDTNKGLHHHHGVYYDDDENKSPMKARDLERRILQVLPQLQSLIDRAVECWPTGVASRSFLVRSAMKHVIRDSITRYAAFRTEIEVVLENLIQLPHRSCVAALGVYRRAAAQAEELGGFHEWCKNMGYCGLYEYPLIDRIPEIQIRALETFLEEIWRPQLTTDHDGERGDVIGDEREVEPLLIKWEDEDEESGGGWEDLLEASISSNANASRNGWEIEVYNPYGFQTPPNPFHHPNRILII